MKLPKFSKNVWGQGIIEFALVLPVMLLIVFGIVDLSRLAFYKSVMNQSAREAVRLVSVATNTATVSDRIYTILTPILGSMSKSNSSGVDDLGNSSTIITFTPTSGNALVAYISPPIGSSMTAGTTVRIAEFYTLDFVTPITTIVGESVNLKSIYYTRYEAP